MDLSQEIKMQKEIAIEAIAQGDFLRAAEILIWLKDNDQINFWERAVVLADKACPEKKFYNLLNEAFKVKFNAVDAQLKHWIFYHFAKSWQESRASKSLRIDISCHVFQLLKV